MPIFGAKSGVIRAIGNVGAIDAVSAINEVMVRYPESSSVRLAAQKALQDIHAKAA